MSDFVISKPSSEDLLAPLTYLRGKISLAQYSIPYLLSAVPWKVATNDFTLIDDLPSSAREEWSLSELFQRDIDWKRIREELVKYLKSDAHPHFFNALTVALIPRDGDTFGGNYADMAAFPPLQSAAGAPPPVQVGGIQFQAFPGSEDTAGLLRWDRNSTVAVAVDGQHRLAAMKELGAQVDDKKRAASKVPVIFLIPDPRAGLVQPPTQPGADHIKTTLRRIFIDLNKHARHIPPARQILLDDQDIHSVCVRRLIADRLTDKPEPGRLPLGLVDWLSDEDNKIESGPFITTVLLLESIVIEALGKRVVHGELDGDEEDIDGIESEIDRIKGWLLQKFAPSPSEMDVLLKQVRHCFDQHVSVAWTSSNLEILGSRFGENWAPHLVRMFSELSPYKRLWHYSAEQGLLRPEMVNLYAAKYIATGPRGEKRATELESAISVSDPHWSLSEHFQKPLQQIDAKLKHGQWAYSVVFQKALFRSYATLRAQHPYFTKFTANTPEALGAFTDHWLAAVSVLLDSPIGHRSKPGDLSSDKFWRGIALKGDAKVSESKIDYSNAGCERISRWVSAFACLRHMEAIPTYAELLDAPPANRLMGTARRLLTHRVVQKGLADLAGAQLQSGSDEQIEKQAMKLANEKYNLMRSIADS